VERPNRIGSFAIGPKNKRSPSSFYRMDHRTATMQIDPDVTSLRRDFPSSEEEMGL
jgi:hypothetical protein